MEIMQRISPTTNIGNSKFLTSSIKGTTYILNSIHITPTNIKIPINTFGILIPFFIVIVFTYSILLIKLKINVKKDFSP